MICERCGKEMCFDCEGQDPITGTYTADFSCMNCGHEVTTEED